MMARSYGRIDVMIWRDADFRALSESEQRLYLVLISQPQMNNCGVLPFTPRRWASLSINSTVEAVDNALKALATANFVVIDHNSEELLVRTFVKHDKIAEQPNLEKAAKREFQAIESERIRYVLQNLYPNLFGKPSERGSTKGLPNGSPRAEPLALNPLALNPSPSKQGLDADDAPEDDLPFEKRSEVARILGVFDQLEETPALTIRSLAASLPLGSLVKVRETAERKRGTIGPGYVINALKSEREERVA